MTIAFYLAALVAVLSTLMVITRLNAVHALLYLIVSLLAVAVIFFLLGAHFVALLEVIIYAGAIMMLFVFAIMMLNLGPLAIAQERLWLPPRAWLPPALLAGVLLGEVGYLLAATGAAVIHPEEVSPQELGALLFGSYLPAVELAALLLLAGLLGAYYLGHGIGKDEP